MKRHRRSRLGWWLLAVAGMAAATLLPAANAVIPDVVAAYSGHTGVVDVSVGGSIADAVNTPDDGKFVQLAPDATITLAFAPGTYAVPDGTSAADLTVHTYDAAYPAVATVHVWVKSNTNAWVSVGAAPDDQGDVGLNLEGVGLVSQVRLVQDGTIDPAYPNLGFDLDAVTAPHSVVLTEACDAVPPGTYTGWTFQSKQFASAVGAGSVTPVVTFASLAEGVGYRFEARGLYNAGPAGSAGTEILADARYSQRVVGQAVPGDEVLGYEVYGPTLLDVLLDGVAVDWQGAPFNVDHAYTADRVGSGAPAAFDFAVYDVFADNNAGGVCVSLFEDATAPAVTAKGVAPSLVQVGSPVQVTATVDDTGKGESWIAAAEWKLDGGVAHTMTPVGALDSKTESFAATAIDLPAGVQSVCVRGQDKAGNWSPWACTTVNVYDRWAKISGVVVGVSGSSAVGAALNVATDKGEPDYAFDGYAYGGGDDVWGSIGVNYKSVADHPVTCTLTPGAAGLFVPYGAAPRPRVDLLGWTGTCSNGAELAISIQLVPRESTAFYGGVTSGAFPRGGVFLNAVPYAGPFTGVYDLSSAYAPFDLWVPLDRGNVHTWVAAS